MPYGEAGLSPFLFAALAMAGLWYAKWQPYYLRALSAAAHRTIGGSLLTGKAATVPAPSWHAALAYASSYGLAVWKALVLSLLLGSCMRVLLPSLLVKRRLGGHGFASVLVASVVAIPGMMCTCCAAPLAMGLRGRQAATGAVLAFWLASPLLNPATLLFILFVLGWKWMALRLALAVPLVLGLGYAANRRESGLEPGGPDRSSSLAGTSDQPSAGALLRLWVRELGTMTLRMVPDYALFVLLLGAARGLLFPHIGPSVTSDPSTIALFALAGLVFVIPTAGEVPIIQAMLGLGVAAGPTAALLLTLPAISLPSIAMVGRVFPARVLALTAAGVLASGLLAGLLAQALAF